MDFSRTTNTKHLLLSSGADLRLGCSPDLLHPVLSADLGWTLRNTLSVETILGLELLGKVHGVVDEGEPGRLAATEVGSEAEGEDPVRGAVVDLGQLVADVALGDGGLAGVQNVHHHLTTTQQAVGHVLPSTNGHGTVRHDVLCFLLASLVEVNQAILAWSF